MKLWVACRETGVLFEYVENIEEGLELIAQYEKEDKKDGYYEPDYYDIVNEEDNCSVIR